MDFTGWEKTNEDAYVLRGFFSDELCDIAFEHSKQAQEAGQFQENSNNKGILLISEPMLEEIIKPVEKIFEGTKYYVDKFLHWYSIPGKPFGIHRDDEAYDPNPHEKAFGGVIYLSDMDGGILYYPESNTWMQPRKGDLVVQSSKVLHGAEHAAGDNKRTITFVVYDPTKESVHMDREWHREFRDDTIRESKEWLDSEVGQRWIEQWSRWGILQKKQYLWEKDIFLAHSCLTEEDLEYFDKQIAEGSTEVDLAVREAILVKVGSLFDLKYSLKGFYDIQKVSDGSNSDMHDDNLVDQDGDIIIKLFLNDNFEGGDVYFPEIDVSWKPVRGSIMCYPANSKFANRVETVIGNDQNFLYSYGELVPFD
jgi:hypothetical protein